MRRLAVLMSAVVLTTVTNAAASECGEQDAQLRLYYNERPPYMASLDNGTVHGRVADVVNRTLTQAGVHHLWIALPTNRHLLMLQHSVECGCAVGWYALPERLQFARFSRPLYRDSAAIAVVRRDFAEPAERRYAFWFQRPELRVLTKQQYSYGDYLDQLLASSRSQRLISTEETPAMLQQLLRGKADMVLLSAEEAQWQIAQLKAEARLRVVEFDDAPPSRTRHLMCNVAVPAALLQRIDARLPASR